MSNIAIIPARGGSKRIPRKNIKEFCGKPIIAYSIEAAICSNMFDEIMVSTDDDEIAEIAVTYGASVPFKRSQETSNDYAGIADVLIEVVEQYSTVSKHYQNICCMFATAPFINQENIIKGYNVLVDNKYCSVISIVKFSYTIYRALQMENGKMSMIWPENYTKRSQDLPESYHDAGQFFWITKNALIENKKIFTSNTGGIELQPYEVQDIDTISDWEMAEMKYRIKNER